LLSLKIFDILIFVAANDINILEKLEKLFKKDVDINETK